MAVPANIAVAWPSTAASIPAGWTRETALDSRYILGAGTGADTDLTTDRGNTTHVHTSPSHTPTQNAHEHDVYTDGSDASTSLLTGTVGGGGPDVLHEHAVAASTLATGTNNGVAITVDAASNDLSIIEVIWIKSNGSPLTFPTGCLAFFESDTLPSGWTRSHGDRYLKGAVAAGNGGGTSGSNTHTHTSPAHTHTQNPHSHTATSTPTTLVVAGRGAGIDVVASTTHSHALTLVATTPTNQSVTTTIDAGNGEPPFKKLNVISASAPDLPTNIIALWLGLNSAIPADWVRYTGMDSKWLKGAAANGQSGITTGGSSQHNHTASNCQPTQDMHSHTVSDPGSTGTSQSAPGFANNFAGVAHTHANWTADPVIGTNNSVGVSIDNCSADAALPKHRTVIFVQYSPSAGPTRPLGGVTTYDIGYPPFGANEEQLGVKPLPEVMQKRWTGDARYFPQEPML